MTLNDLEVRLDEKEAEITELRKDLQQMMRMTVSL